MTTGQMVLFGGAVSLCSGALSVGLVVLVFRFWIRPKLDAHFDAASVIVAAKVRMAVSEAGDQLLPQFEASVRRGFRQSADEVLPRFREEVKGGFLEAADEVMPRLKDEVGEGVESGAQRILPRLRREVAEGVKDGLVGAIDPEVVTRAGESVARAGSSVIEKGLNLIFGHHDEDS